MVNYLGQAGKSREYDYGVQDVSDGVRTYGIDRDYRVCPASTTSAGLRRLFLPCIASPKLLAEHRELPAQSFLGHGIS